MYSADDPANPVAPKEGDSQKGTFEFKTVMLLSHGCEVEQVQRDGATAKRSWLTAPISELRDCSTTMQQRTRENRQPNKFYLPPSEYGENQEWYVDLRKITPIQCRYIMGAKKLFSLSPPARMTCGVALAYFSLVLLYITNQFNVPNVEQR